MLKGFALILLVSLVFSQQQIEGADIQGREEGKPLTPIGGGHMTGGQSIPISTDLKKANGQQITEQEKLIMAYEQLAREDFREQFNEQLLSMTYTRQIVAGTNYYLSFKRSNGDTVRYHFFKPLPAYQVKGEDYMEYTERTIIPKGH